MKPIEPSERDYLTRKLQKQDLIKDLDWQQFSSASAPEPQMPENARLCPENPPHPPAPDGLSQRQLIAIELLVQGLDNPDICRRLRLDPKTLYRWKRQNSLFKSHLNRRRSEIWSAASDHFRKLLLLSAQVLHEQLQYGSDDSSFRAAYAILQLANRFHPRAHNRVPSTKPPTTNNQSPITNDQ